MGNSSGQCKALAKEDEYIQRIRERRRNIEIDTNFNMTTRSHKEMIDTLVSLLDSVFREDKDILPVENLRKQIRQFQGKDVTSMASFIAWELEFLDILRDSEDQKFNSELENKRTSQFMKINNSMIRIMIQAFDQGITAMYENEINHFLKLTCDKYNNIGYKKKTIQKMIAFLIEIDAKELKPLESTEEKKLCITILRRILRLIKQLGIFISLVLKLFSNQLLDTNRKGGKTEYESTILIMNLLLKFSFGFYVYSTFLSKIFILKDINIWQGRKKMEWKTNNGQGFSDLIYLRQFITSEHEQRNLRMLTKKTMELQSDDQNYTYHFAQINHKRMELNEFLVHLNQHLKLNLDQVFFSNLSDILFYFNNIEEFMEEIFKNAELEIKIDLIRLILRVNDSTEYIYRIFMIHNMDLEFLNECQIFALFNQVVLCSELKIKMNIK